MDPVYKLCEIYYPFVLADVYTKYSLGLFRFIAIQHICAVSGRIALTIGIPFLTMLHTLMGILKLLWRKNVTRQTILLHNQIHCINHMVIDVWKVLNAMILGVPFVLLIVINWILISRWKLFGLEIYSIGIAGCVGAYFFVILALQWFCQVDERSREVIHG